MIIPVAANAEGPGQLPAVGSMERQRYPGPLEVIVVSARETGDDPGLLPEATGKLRNLSAGVSRARQPVLLFCDADVEAPTGLVRDLVGALCEPGTGLAYALPCWTGGRSLPALLLAAWANAQVATFLLPATRLASRLPVTGAAVAVPRAVLAQIGGMAALAGYLADDARLGELVQAAGYRATPRGWVQVRAGRLALPECLSAVLRWLLTLRHHTPVAYAVSYLTHWVAAALVWGVAAGMRGGWPGQAWLPLVVVALLRVFLSALPVLRARGGHPVARATWPALLTPLADLIAVLLWPLPLFARRITWAGTNYLVLKAGRVEPVPGPLPGGGGDPMRVLRRFR